MNVVILAVADQLARRGIEVDLLTRAVGEPGATELGPGVVLYELAAGPEGPLPRERLGEVADEFGEAIAAITGRRTPRYDLIHAHYWLSGLAALPVALELGLPFVQSFHTVAAMKNAGLGPGQSPEPERRLRTEHYLAGQAGGIVAGSAAEATALIDLVKAPADRIWVVPPGVDVDRFSPAHAAGAARVRASLRIPDGPLLAVVGRLQPLKDQELAIRVLAAMPEPRPTLVIAGDPSPGESRYADELLLLARAVGVADRVRFPGALARPELADLLAAADLVLVPSRSETFGLIALEAAASATPVIGSRAGGLAESIADGGSGVLLDSRDPGLWAGVIHSLLSDRGRLAALSRSARDHAERCRWGATAAALLGVYSAVQDGRP